MWLSIGVHDHALKFGRLQPYYDCSPLLFDDELNVSLYDAMSLKLLNEKRTVFDTCCFGLFLSITYES